MLDSCAFIKNTRIVKRRYRPGVHVDQSETSKKGEDNRQKREGHYDETNHTKRLSGESFFYLNALPMESLRLGYSFLFAKRFAAGIDASVLYKFLYMARGGITLVRHNAFTTTDYFTLKNNMFLFGPYFKWYFKAGEETYTGYYLKVSGLYTPLIDGLKSDYFNKQDVPLKISADAFTHMSTSNLAYTELSGFKSWGFDVVAGHTLFIDLSHHWLFDMAAGYHYLYLPAFVKEPRVVKGITYYYHDSPMWKNPLALPLCTQLSFVYKF